MIIVRTFRAPALVTSGTLSACLHSLEDTLPSQACLAHVVSNQDRGGFFFCPKIAVKNKLPSISFEIESGTPLSLKCGFSLMVETILEQGYGCCGIFDHAVNPESAFVLIK